MASMRYTALTLRGCHQQPAIWWLAASTCHNLWVDRHGVTAAVLHYIPTRYRRGVSTVYISSISLADTRTVWYGW